MSIFSSLFIDQYVILLFLNRYVPRCYQLSIINSRVSLFQRLLRGRKEGALNEKLVPKHALRQKVVCFYFEENIAIKTTKFKIVK